MKYLEEALLAEMKIQLTPDPITQPLIAFNLSQNPKTSPFIVGKSEDVKKNMVDESTILSFSQFFSKLNNRIQEESDLKKLHKSETIFINDVFNNIQFKINFFLKQIKDKLLSSFMQNLATKFIEDYKNGVLKFSEDFKTRSFDLCKYLGLPLVVEKIDQELFQKKTEFLIGTINDLLSSTFNEYSAEVATFIPVGVQQKNIIQSTLNDFICFAGRGVNHHPFQEKYAILTCGGKVQLRDTSKHQIIIERKFDVGDGDDTHYNCLAWNPNGKILAVAGSINRKIYIVHSNDLTIKKEIGNFKNIKDEEIWNICWISESFLIIGFSNGIIIQFDIGYNACVNQINLQKECGIESICPYYSGFLVGASDGSIYAFSNDLKLQWDIQKYHKDRVMKITLNKNKNKICTGSNDQFVSVFNLQKNKVIFKKSLEDSIFDVAWGTRDQYIIVQLEFSFRLGVMFPGTGEILAWFQAKNQSLNGIIISLQNDHEFIIFQNIPNNPLVDLLCLKVV